MLDVPMLLVFLVALHHLLGRTGTWLRAAVRALLGSECRGLNQMFSAPADDVCHRLGPKNGSIAIGSKRSWPTSPAAAAVVSALIVAPRKTPCSQSNASRTSGTTLERRPPNRN